MKTITAILGAFVIGTTAAQAGGIDRSRLSFGTLFEKGNYVEFGFSHVAPKVSGVYRGLPGPAAAFNGLSTGDLAVDYTTLSFAYKRDINDRLAYGVFLNTPYGANSQYSAAPGLYTGLTAKWDSKQAAIILKYKANDNISVYGGLKLIRSSATIAIPDALIRGGLARAGAAGNATAAALAGGAPAGTLAYTASGAGDSRVAGIIGVAYEKPEIALRVGLTYESGFTHKFTTVENVAAVPSIFGTGVNGITSVKMPQSVTLDFQSGVAKDTLVFGSVRWSEWSKWEVRPVGYQALTGGNVTDFTKNVLTWQLGVGRKLNDNFSVFARVGYEKSRGLVASRLSPTDGNKSFGIGGTYTKGPMKVTAGLEYVKVGDAVDGSNTNFTGNKAIGFGMSVGYRF